MNKYFYTFGSWSGYPHQNGWVEIHANTRQEANEKFRARYPDLRKNVMNYAFCYTEERWRQMDPSHNWPGYRCYAVIE